MHSYTDGGMAIPRVFNSNTPFIIVSGGTELSFLGKEENKQNCDEEKESLVQAITPHLGRVMQHGTAKHMVTQGREGSEENTCVSIVAQAEREDFQEFSPTITQGPFSRSQQLKKLRSVSKESAFISDTEDEDFDVSTEPPHYHLQRKQRRKARTRPSLKEGEEPPVICGLWVQEIDWLKTADAETVAAASSAEIIPPPPQFTDSVSCSCCHREPYSSTCDEGCSSADVCDCVRESEDVSASEGLSRSIISDETSSSEDRAGSDSDCGLDQASESVCTYESDSDSSCCSGDDTQTPERLGVEANVSNSTFDLMHVSGFNLCRVDWDYDSPEFLQGLLGVSDSTCISRTVSTTQEAFGYDDPSDTEEGLDAAGGGVTQMPKLFASPLFEDLIKETLKDWTHNVAHNEGLIFHHQLQPSSCQYREGEEYNILHHIQNGSYGDVFCVQDKRTGFKCAAKRIPLSHFSCEEVHTWSALNSPRVVELFGAVREGPNMVLFMDLKPACLAQPLKDMKFFPEDLALHYLLQTLGALEHLHHRGVVHLDVKVDNVLLSADCRDTFLCDFGLSETLDSSGHSSTVFRGAAFPGTQTHMAPEVARGDQLSAKADVWSSCCMLLHMLNGCHPWIRYYSHPLCLQIVNEPPPLWEVPSTCNNFTAQVFRAGLQKEPDRRASAKELRKKTTKALRAVGGLSPLSVTAAFETLHRGTKTQTADTPCSLSSGPSPNKPTGAKMHWVSPWRTTAVEEDGNDKDEDLDHVSEVETELDSKPRSLRDDYAADEKDWDTESESDIDIYMGEEELMQERWLKTDREYEGDWEEEGQEEEEEEEEKEEEDEDWDSSVATEYLRALRGLFPLLQKGRQTNDSPWGSEAELEYLRDDVPKGTMIQTPSPEPRDDPPSCFSCSDTSQIGASEKDSEHSSDDLSSGVFSSCNSQTGGHLEWLVENQLPSHCFDGVDIWIENIQGECLRIREHRQVKVGHIAIGISDQISGKAFTLETLDRKLVSFDEEINESCVWFRCVPAPDTCQRWTWRIRNGKLELQE